MALDFTRPTDATHTIQLDSFLQQGLWVGGRAVIGHPAGLLVRTSLVGEGAPIEITARAQNGGTFATARGTVRGNTFVGEVEIPASLEPGDQVWFEIRLPDNGLSGESNRIPVIAPPVLEELRWSQETAGRGDRLTLTARVRNLPDRTPATLIIYEHDRDGLHDRITEIETEVRDGRVEVRWEYEYHEETDELPTEEELQTYGEHYNPPEYFFTLRADGFELGLEQESGLLRFQDWIGLELRDAEGEPLAGHDYVLHLPDGTTREGTLDDQGRAREEEIPPGPVRVEVPDGDSDADADADAPTSDTSETGDTSDASTTSDTSGS